MLIFLPNVRGANPFLLDGAGIGYLAKPSDAPSFSDLESPGPGGKPGVLVGWLGDRPTAKTESFGYIPSRQTWIESPTGKYWVGWQNDMPPSPDTLARENMIRGPVIELGDGRDWQLIAPASLPQRARLAANGWEWAPERKFSAFIERTAWAFDVAKRAIGGGSIPVEAADYAIEVLTWNYRITPEIADHLGLFTAESLFYLLAVTTDREKLAAIGEELKKVESQPIPSG